MPDEPALEAEVVEEEVRNLPAVRTSEALVARDEISVDEVVAQKDKIVQIMQRVMEKDVHYGVIPGTGKPSLLKPGAEAILVALRLAPHYESEKIIDGNHLTVFVRCELQHITTGLVIATGEGMCTTRESRYAYRTAKRKCPDCGAEAIIKGKAEYGGGWVCWKKEGGCGHNFPDDDARVNVQTEGKVDNPDVPDQWNTVLKMADKRALIAAVLNGTAASDVFTQDVEDAAGASGAPEPVRLDDGHTVTPPRSWAKVKELVQGADNKDEAWALFEAFVRATSYHLFGETDSKKLTADQRKVILQKASGAAVFLAEHAEDDGPFTYYLEEHQREAFASVLEGVRLEIPDYKPPAKTSAEQEAEDLDEEAAAIADEVFAEAGKDDK